MSPQKIYIIGIGDDGVAGLTVLAQQLIDDAEIIVGPSATLAMVTNQQAQHVEIGASFDDAVKLIGEHPERRIVVLATGDPLFYGIARYLCGQLGKERFEVVPHVRTMQLAFARVKESWDEAYLTNLASQELERVVERVRTAEKVGLFTTEEIPPNQVAQALLESRIDYFLVYVCENLGAPDERVTQGSVADVAQRKFSPLNVMILVRQPDVPDHPSERAGRRIFGNPDEAFLQSRPKQGLLTPAEVRSMALAELELKPNSTVWDVGAGSGSVAIEAAQIASQGHVYAIEMDPDDHQLIAANAERFAIGNLTAVLGEAPAAWDDLPDADAVFVGGTGRQVQRLVELAWDRLSPGGRLVVNVATVENLASLRALLGSRTDQMNVWMVNVARGVFQFECMRFESLNPTYVIAAVKEPQSGTTQ